MSDLLNTLVRKTKHRTCVAYTNVVRAECYYRLDQLLRVCYGGGNVAYIQRDAVTVTE